MIITGVECFNFLFSPFLTTLMGFIEGKEPVASRGPCRWASGIALRAACCVLLLDAGAGLFLGQQSSDAGRGHGLFMTYAGAASVGHRASPMSYGTGAMVMNTITDIAVPMLEEAAMRNVIPAQEGDRLSVEEMRMQDFSIGSVAADIASLRSDKASVGMGDIQADIGVTKFVFDCGLFKCPGTLRVKVDKTQLQSDIHAYSENQLMRVAMGADTTAIAWGNLGFEHEFDNWYCRAAEWIVEIFTKFLYDVVLVFIKEQLTKILLKILEELINYLLSSIGVRLLSPFAIDAAQAALKLGVTPSKLSSSSVTPDLEVARLSAALDGEASSPVEAPLTNEVGAVLFRDSINDLLRRATRAGSLNYAMELSQSMVAEYAAFVIPGITEVCAECRMLVSVAATSGAPVADFDASGARLAVQLKNVEVALFALPETAEQHAALRANLASGAADSTMVTADPSAPAELFPATPVNGSFPVPLVSFAVNATAAVKGVSVGGKRRNMINYEVEPVTGLSVKLLASEIGSVDVQRVHTQMNLILNFFAVPHLNQNSPYELPDSIDGAVFEITTDRIVAGFNMSHS